MQSPPRTFCFKKSSKSALFSSSLNEYGGMGGPIDEHPTTLWFDLTLSPFRKEWKGKLIIRWPGKELAWHRWADKNKFEIHAILEESILERRMAPWRQLVLRWNDLTTTPKSWQVKLKEWRGVYLIFDVSDGKSYVGSAYGSENLYHRWRDYAKSGHGNNKYLKPRDPTNFRFSILQRVSPDMSEANVTRLEHTWMERLHTRRPFGLND